MRQPDRPKSGVIFPCAIYTRNRPTMGSSRSSSLSTRSGRRARPMSRVSITPELGRNPRTPGDYEVGYGRPPRAHRFKKGEPSRNPKGRPRGTNRPAPDLVAALWQPVTIRMQGKERKVLYPETMIQVAKDKALKGDQRAARTLINLLRELDILKPQEAFNPRTFTLYIGRPGDKSKE
jgi:hypothetical protein